jgi:hypothetical protein
MTKFIIRKIRDLRKIFAKGIDSEEIEKRRNRVIEAHEGQIKIITQLKETANKKQELENIKNDKGLKIIFALYGNRQGLKRLQDEILYVHDVDGFVQDFANQVDNEVVDVTIPVRFLIKHEEEDTYASILFYQIPKTKILGFINPIFSSDKHCHLLIRY